MQNQIERSWKIYVRSNYSIILIDSNFRLLPLEIFSFSLYQDCSGFKNKINNVPQFYFLPSGQVYLEAMYRTLLKLVFRLCLTPWPPLILAEWLKIYMQFVCYKYSPQQCIFMLWIQEEHGFFAFPLDCVSGRNAVNFKFTEEIKFESSIHF